MFKKAHEILKKIANKKYPDEIALDKLTEYVKEVDGEDIAYKKKENGDSEVKESATKYTT